MSTVTAAAPKSNLAARPSFKEKYEHYINGEWVAPSGGEYFDNISPIDGKMFTQAARGNAKDIDKAIDAATEAFKSWSKTAASQRSNILLRIAQVIEDNLEYLAIIETIDNGKALRETRAADLPLVVDHFRYFAGVIRSEEGTISEHDETTVSINLHEPIGVVGQITYGCLENSSCIGSRLHSGCKTCRANTYQYNVPYGISWQLAAKRGIEHCNRFWCGSR
jgi:aldehyde dehydrogenase